jgi:hypothetical protein
LLLVPLPSHQDPVQEEEEQVVVAVVREIGYVILDLHFPIFLFHGLIFCEDLSLYLFLFLNFFSPPEFNFPLGHRRRPI